MALMRGSLLAVLAALAAAQPRWVRLEPDVPVHNPLTSSWLRGAKPPKDHQLRLTVAVRVDDDRRAELERVFWEVSDPRSAGYGKHLDLDAVNDLLAVPEERSQRVEEYFKSWGATEVKAAPGRDMIAVAMPVAAAEAALRTEIRFFAHPARPGFRLARASAPYWLPSEIAGDVALIGELLQFPRLAAELPGRNATSGKGQWPNDCDVAACAGLVTPGVLATRYKVPNGTLAELAGTGASMAVAEFQGQFFKENDLKSFSSACHRPVDVAKVVGKEEQMPGIEAELDIEYIRSVAPEIPLTVVYNSMYSLLNWANQITSMSDAPLVHSVSYGNDEKQQSGAAFMETCNTAFMKAGVRGISILFASGDQGVCGREGCGFIKIRFKPDFPAGSPYITAVGGTNFLGAGIGEETAWSASGGGFSDEFPMPSYQSDAVSAYKGNPSAKLPPASMWNASGRGYPDVAALGGTKTPYCVTAGGHFEGVAGTSASSPVVAGVFARLNALRLAAGKPAMGFLNPFIYQNPSGFQDVTKGVNKAGSKYGFAATEGWDPATGMGTPDFEALSKLALASGAAATAQIVV